MEETILAPMAVSVIPRLSRSFAWPSAVAFPWLPMAGIMMGVAPASFRIQTAVLRICSRFCIFLLPAVIPMVFPDRFSVFKKESASRVEASISGALR